MKKIVLIALTNILMLGLRGETIPVSCYNDSHDITSLSAWGPYSKRYAGISHIADMKSGMRFDFSVMPGYYRNRQLVPHVLFESSYYPWQINPAMDRITYRYELEWKDRVYVDVTYYVIDSLQTLVEMKCVNNTSSNQNLVFNNIAYIDYPESQPKVEALNAHNLRWYSAIDYSVNEPAVKTAQYGLVYDGWRRNEERSSGSLDGSLLARGFGRNKGDKVVYKVHIPDSQLSGSIALRYNAGRGEKCTFVVRGLVGDTITLNGGGEFEMFTIPYQCKRSGDYPLEFISLGGGAVQLDGFFVGTEKDIKAIQIAPKSIPFTPKIERGKNGKSFVLKYPECENYYGVVWDFGSSEIREILNGELESFLRRKVHDHVSRTLVGDRGWHYTDAFLRPVVMTANSQQTLYTLLCTGTKEQVAQNIGEFSANPHKIAAQTIAKTDTQTKQYLPQSAEFAFGQQLLQASLLSNVVYPVYTQREYIRHFTPGKNWNSLYTWDLGFIALGLVNVDQTKAFECIRAYTTPVGDESAFIHHGTPLPIQFFAYQELWNSDQSVEALKFLYPRLKQFFDFMVGNNPNSTTRMAGSGLIRTWDYFYNSGGWDDYPPQQDMHSRGGFRTVTPVVSSAYYIRAAKIMRLAAKELGLKDDVKKYDKVIETLSGALQKHSWDSESGYFGYVNHDAQGNATTIYRARDGSNFNKGLDGVSPVVSGICSDDQTDRLVSHLFSPDQLWTDVGLSTVDQSASYYKADGYWNGAVWFPHQWTIWKAMLDAGRGAEAGKIALTALRTWEKECEQSYFTFEHFIISSGRGAGWHQFSGLSSPILNWYAAYFEIGKVSTGFEVWLEEGRFNDDKTGYRAKVAFDDSTLAHERCMMIVMNPDFQYTAYFNGKALKTNSLYSGLIELTLPATNKAGTVEIKKDE